MDKNNLLIFYMKTGYSTTLVEGKLLLIKNGVLFKKYDATSGCPGYQSRQNIHEKGKGALPPNVDIDYKNYIVNTFALNRVKVKGIEGNAYAITPSALLIKGIQRGDFMVHRDANVPGSAGCIVLINNKEWADFEREMSALYSSGISSIPLIVDYYGS